MEVMWKPLWSSMHNFDHLFHTFIYIDIAQTRLFITKNATHLAISQNGQGIIYRDLQLHRVVVEDNVQEQCH